MGTFLAAATPPQREEMIALQELFNSVTASPLAPTIFPTPPPIDNPNSPRLSQSKEKTLR